jgi:uncharacterized protein YjbI with pentapeptide repeats
MRFLGKWLIYMTVKCIYRGQPSTGFLMGPGNVNSVYLSAADDPNQPPPSQGIFNVYDNNGSILLQYNAMLRYVSYNNSDPDPALWNFVINPDAAYAIPASGAALTVNEGPFQSALAGARINSQLNYYQTMNPNPNTGSVPIGIPYDDEAFVLIADAPDWNAESAMQIQVVTPAPAVIMANAYAPGYDLTNIDLTGVDLTNADLRLANFTGATLNQTCLANCKMAGAILPNQDLTKLDPRSKTAPPSLAGTSSNMTILSGSIVPFALLGLDWSYVDLTNATIPDLPSSLDGLKATGARLAGLNKNNLIGLSLKHAVLDDTLLDGVSLAGANLSGASLINASMFGVALTNADLSGANLTGAQLGAITPRFTLPLSLESALEAGTVSAISPTFAQNKITLSANALLSTLADGRVWKLEDAGTNAVYTIRLEPKSDGTQTLTVYSPEVAASLVGAYMPNAKLSGANLYGVPASEVQFYADTGVASIDGSAILEEADFSGANLSNLDLTQAQLQGTHFAGAQLFNAKFNKANLTPAASGVATNLSGANLQGADFTDAQLYGAILANAAVAIPVPIPNFPNQGGVYLFTLPYSGDPAVLQQYVTELNSAGNKFSLNPQGDADALEKYVTALQNGATATFKVAFLEQNPPIKLSTAAQIQVVAGETNVWQIVDGNNSYTLWESIDGNGNTELYAAAALTNLRAGFQQESQTLRWQAAVSVGTANQQWEVDNDSQNPKNLNLGYVKFVIALNGSVLDVYGTAIRIERLGATNQSVIDTESCNVTQIQLVNLTPDTSCPNGSSLVVNQQKDGVKWDLKWMRARTPPSPPTCVPTDNSWCPQSTVSDLDKTKISSRDDAQD